MFGSVFNSKIPSYKDTGIVFKASVTILKPSGIFSEGKVSSVSQFSVFDIASSLAPFSSVDFSISSLNSVGALSKLKSTYMSTMSDLNVADSFDTLTFENYENA